jgi:hypothetical protein
MTILSNGMDVLTAMVRLRVGELLSIAFVEGSALGT